MSRRSTSALGGARRGRGRRNRTRPGSPSRWARRGEQDGSARILADMNAYRDTLAARCADMQKKMAALATAIDTVRSSIGSGVRAGSARRRPAAGRRVGGGRSGRRSAGRSLKDYITRVLGSAGSPMRLVDVAHGVVNAGYPTRSKNLPNQVSMAMAAMVKQRRVRKLSRGLYSLPS